MKPLVLVMVPNDVLLMVSIMAELERAGQQLIGFAAGLEHLDLFDVALPVPLLQFRFGIEQIHLARTAVLHELDDCRGGRLK